MVRDGRREFSVEGDVFHGVMLAVARPEGQVMEGGCRRYERISQLYMVALGILSEIFSRSNSNIDIDGDGLDRGEKRLESCKFLWTGPVPEFSDKALLDRKSTRLNSSHQIISYAVFCLKKKKTQQLYCAEVSKMRTG